MPLLKILVLSVWATNIAGGQHIWQVGNTYGRGRGIIGENEKDEFCERKVMIFRNLKMLKISKSGVADLY